MKKTIKNSLTILLFFLVTLLFILTSCTIDSKASILSNKSILKLNSDEEIDKLKKDGALIDDIDALNSSIIRIYENNNLVKLTIYQRMHLDAQKRKDIDFSKINEEFINNDKLDKKYKNKIISPIVNIIVFEKDGEKFKISGYVVEQTIKDLGNNQFKLELKYYKMKNKMIEKNDLNNFISILDNPKMKKNQRNNKGLNSIIKLEDFADNIKIKNKEKKEIEYTGNISQSEYLDGIVEKLNEFFKEREMLVNLMPAMQKENLPKEQKYNLKEISNKKVKYSKNLDSKEYNCEYTFNKKTASFTICYDNNIKTKKQVVNYINGVNFDFYQLIEEKF